MLDPRSPVMKLSELVKRLSPEQSGPIEQRRTLIVRRIHELRRLHVETAVLLAQSFGLFVDDHFAGCHARGAAG